MQALLLAGTGNCELFSIIANQIVNICNKITLQFAANSSRFMNIHNRFKNQFTKSEKSTVKL